MSGSPLTVPPPHDDDHEDVAWALRAASAQWKRAAHSDAIVWIQRAAETAEKVGNGPRFTELCLLAAALERAVSSGSVPPGPPRFSSAPPSVEVAEVDVDFDLEDDGVEMLDDEDGIEILDEVEELEDFEELEDVDELVDVDDARELESTSSRPPAPERGSYRPSSSSPPSRSVAARASSSRPAARSSLPASVRSPSSGRPEVRSTASSRAGVPASSRSGTPPCVRSGARTSTSSRSTGSSSAGFSSAGPRSTSPRSTSPRGSAFSRPSGASRSTSPGGSSAGSISRLPKESRSSKPAPGSKPGKRNRPTTTSRRLDRLPPSMRPEPSGLDLADEVEDMDEEAVSSRPSFGELEFEDEGPTNRVELRSAPPPDLGGVHFVGASEIPFAHETAAEYAQSRHPIKHDHDELERELGVDLSVPSGKISREQQAPVAPAPWGVERTEPSERPSISSAPPGALDEASLSDSDAPVVGRASVIPTSSPGAERITSAESEPYALAPSATLPPTAEIERPTPPPHSSQAPPPDLMVEPREDRVSELPSVGTRRPPQEGPAPDLDEFEDMFDKLSRPPPGSDTEIPALEHAPVQSSFPPDLVAPSSRGGEIRVDGLDFMEIEGFQDLPPDAARALARTAELRTLKTNEEVSGFGVALVTHGAVRLMPTIADATCRIARKGEVLFTKGTLERSAAVRVVGMDEGSRVAVFSAAALEAATSSCPWVADDLAQIADRHLAFAGAVLGALGDSLDEMFRFMVLDKCGVKAKPEGAILAEAGKPMDGLYVLGAGALELLSDDSLVEEQLAMGDFVFPETVLSAAPAARTVRIGKGGALLLYADRMSAHELLATCPPLVEILAG